MIGLDTNILVRYLAQDDTIQSAAATDLIENRLTSDEPGFVSIIAMTELARVLHRAYRIRGCALADLIERLLFTDVLAIEHPDLVFAASLELRAHTADFADALIVRLGTQAGCTVTHTFDRAAARLSGYALLRPGAAL